MHQFSSAARGWGLTETSVNYHENLYISVGCYRYVGASIFVSIRFSRTVRCSSYTNMRFARYSSTRLHSFWTAIWIHHLHSFWLLRDVMILREILVQDNMSRWWCCHSRCDIEYNLSLTCIVVSIARRNPSACTNKEWICTSTCQSLLRHASIRFRVIFIDTCPACVQDDRCYTRSSRYSSHHHQHHHYHTNMCSSNCGPYEMSHLPALGFQFVQCSFPWVGL